MIENKLIDEDERPGRIDRGERGAERGVFLNGSRCAGYWRW